MPHIRLDWVLGDHLAIVQDFTNFNSSQLTVGERIAYLKQERLLIPSTKVASSAVRAQVIVDTTCCSSDLNK